MRALRYALDEALVSLRRAGRSAAMSMGTIAIAFLTLGGFLLASANLQVVIERWASAAEMSVYLQDGLDQAAVHRLRSELSAHEAVAGVEYVSKDEALARFQSDFPELADVSGTMQENPFPASLEVRLRSDTTAASAAEVLAAQLGARSGITDVRYDRQWLSRLLAAVAAIRVGGFVVAGILVLGAAFTVASVVRLSLIARRDELEIMHLVGSPFAYIRGPSIAEGTLLAGIGAAVALIALWGVFAAIRGELGAALTGFLGVTQLRFLSLEEALLLVGTALGVGALAGGLASRIDQ